MSDVICQHCGAEIPQENRAAGISSSIDYDEYIYSYWRCDGCSFYTIRCYYEPFLGEDPFVSAEVNLLGAIPKETAAQIIALIKACPDPRDKLCECESHQKIYRGRLRD